MRVPHAKKQLDVLTGLIGATFEAYGDVGIYDPERLAKVDFLTNPNPNPSPSPNPNPDPDPSPNPNSNRDPNPNPKLYARTPTKVDFLNQPELLVALVAESAGGGVSEDMAKMKEVTVSWI